jgi:hypothetical protein
MLKSSDTTLFSTSSVEGKPESPPALHENAWRITTGHTAFLFDVISTATRQFVMDFAMWIFIQFVMRFHCADRSLVGLTRENANEIVAVFAWLQ